MKKRIFLMVALIAGLGFTACSVDTSDVENAADEIEQKMKDDAEEIGDEVEGMEDAVDSETEGGISNVMYQCPDDCENGPAYFDPGPCKKCGKEMVEI